MDVYVIQEEHRAEGLTILAILDSPITPDESQPIIKRSIYDNDEKKGWCRYSCQLYKVEDINNLGLNSWIRTLWGIDLKKGKLYRHSEKGEVTASEWP